MASLTSAIQSESAPDDTANPNSVVAVSYLNPKRLTTFFYTKRLWTGTDAHSSCKTDVSRTVSLTMLRHEQHVRSRTTRPSAPRLSEMRSCSCSDASAHSAVALAPDGLAVSTTHLTRPQDVHHLQLLDGPLLDLRHFHHMTS